MEDLLLRRMEGRWGAQVTYDLHYPATAAGNWAWRVSPRYNTEKLRARMLDLTVKTKRNK